MPDYKPGTPSWVDLGTPDVDASAKFYSALFGWTAEKAEDPAAGGYTIFKLGEDQVAGASPLMMPEQPPAWMTYVSVEDADATTSIAASSGGQVIMPGMDVLDVGRMAVIADPTGAVICLWQPRAHKGADLVNAPGALTWNELSTRDTTAAAAFYSKVFAWEADSKGSDENPYTEWKLDGKTIGGMMPMGAQIPAEVPSYWLVYFAVADTDAVVAKTEELGGTVQVPATDIPQGRFAVLADPHGATFAVIKMAF
ncbi:MAG TPA: VOC family protein [Candidatus Dormibacteraeota bacterium]|jgi:hypothetical protein|nr:VOC family protein [Candidatus Dormibacteraeota bacterium]